MNKKKAPGPKPDTLVLEGDWQEAMKKAVAKAKPPGGWPAPPTKKRAKRKKR